MKQIKSFPEAVLLRPEMYTLDGNYEEVVAFLEGYYSGAARGNPYAPPVHDWQAFKAWMADQLSISPSDVLRQFRELPENNQAPLKKLAEWYAKYQERS